jgi:D-alanyl-lipoteichoic acid acyltransferase DltB (MBOAT superfamily)
MYQGYQAAEDPAARPVLSAKDIAEALERITRGIFKTNVLALLLSTLHTRMVESVTASHPMDAELLPGALMFVLFPFFLYCNFSGYIDIVIGVGRLLGVTLPENFARPFASDSAIEFWSNRWHITLSGWLKTYVYNPMLMTLMRRFPSPGLASTWSVSAIFVTFFLIGVWHGQTSEFLFFGFLFGFGVSVNTIYQIVIIRKIGRKRYAALTRNPLYTAIARGLTFTGTAFTLIWFWSNWNQIRVIETALGAKMLIAIWIAIFAGATILLAAWETAYNRMVTAPWNGVPLLSQCLRTAWSTTLIVVIVAVNLLLNQPAPEIVYKSF